MGQRHFYNTTCMKLVLASNSPRRIELLRNAGLDFESKAGFGFDAKSDLGLEPNSGFARAPKSDFGFAPNAGFILDPNPGFGFEPKAGLPNPR